MIDKISTLQDVQDLYAWFQTMRDTQPVWRDERSGFWHIFRFSDVNTVISDYHTFSSARPRVAGAESATTTSTQENSTPGFGKMLTQIDPPLHRHYRNLVSPSFTPRALSSLAERIAAIAQELVDKVRARGHMDFVTDFAYPLPATVIAEMLGVPLSDRPIFKQWADGLFATQLSDADIERFINQPAMAQQFTRIAEEMHDYFKTLLEERHHQPRKDMMSELLAAEIEGERLHLEDVISFCILLLLAGHVTTTNLLSQAIRCFSEHPAAQDQLRAQPGLMPGAVEEVLRYASPVWRLLRTTKSAVTLNDITIPAGSWVFSWLASANRDERQFSEPEQFTITRTPNHHLSFGHGIHFCLGAPLARLEACTALPILIEQLPDLRVAPDQPSELLEGISLFGFQHLPITFTAALPTTDIKE